MISAISTEQRLVFVSGRKIRFFGYDLQLGRGEFDLLRLIAEHSPECTSVEDITDIGIAPKSLPVMVSTINKKAAAISGRRLIVSCRGRGYRLNEFM